MSKFFNFFNFFPEKQEDEGSSGEANTASNVGISGVGFYSNKSGVDLQFKNLKENSTYLTVVDNPIDKTVRIDASSSTKSLISNAVPNSRTINGHTLNSNIIISKDDIGLGDVVLVKEERVFRSLLTSASFITPINKTAYFVYLGKTVKEITPLYVEFYQSALGDRIDLSEVGIFISDAPPMKRDQRLTKIISSKANIDNIGICRNDNIFERHIDLGSYLWVGLRISGETLPRISGLIRDFGEGFILMMEDSPTFDESDRFNGTLIKSIDTRESPDLRLTLD